MAEGGLWGMGLGGGRKWDFKFPCYNATFAISKGRALTCAGFQV